jgi:hypothetical protein
MDFFFAPVCAVYAQWHGPWLRNRMNAVTEKISEYINWIKQNVIELVTQEKIPKTDRGGRNPTQTKHRIQGDDKES